MPRDTERERDLNRLKHIDNAAREARKFLGDQTKKRFSGDRKLGLALIKDLEIIGEAASKISPEFKRMHPKIPWSDLVDTRNRLIHGYFDIDLEIIWDTVKYDLPKLIEILKPLLHR